MNNKLNKGLSKIFFLLIIAFLLLILFFSVYCFFLGERTIQEARQIQKDRNAAHLTINFNGEKRIFQGDTTNFGIELSEAIALTAEIGNFDYQFETNEKGEIFLKKIGDKLNGAGHYWVIILPHLGWAQAIGPSFDLRKIILTGGIEAELVYR